MERRARVVRVIRRAEPGVTSPVRREVLVKAAPARAFELFTDHLGSWWPLELHSVFGVGTVGFEGDQIVERLGEQVSVWGTVTTWNPPGLIAFTWHPGEPVARATNVSVSFVARGEETLVTLVHTGWERALDPDAAAADYNNGWPTVLARFAGLVAE